jgi:nitrous oxidase accessory protein NosD
VYAALGFSGGPGTGFPLRRLSAVMLVLGLIIGASAARVGAATFNVDCTSNPGALAIALVSATDGDTLTISGTCKGTFEISHNLTLTGSVGATLDGQEAGTVLTVDSGKSVALTGLVITGGSTSLYTNGGGIANGGSLTITNSTITGNTTGYSGNGGGIYSAGTLTLNNTTVSANSTSLYANGAGIYNDGSTVTLTNSTINGNTTGYAGNGGGIYSTGGTLTMTGGTVSGNTASLKAGGIYGDGTLTLTNSTVSVNTSTFDGGGGIFKNSGTLTLSQSSVTGNTAGGRGGGGIDSVSGSLTLTDSEVGNNNGGGIFSESGTLTLDRSTVNGNANGGGGIESDSGTAALNNSTISNNGPRGIFNGNATVTVNNSTVSGNVASGIFNSGTLVLTNSTVSGNSGFGTGGGIENFFYGTLTVRNSTISGNTASYGGGIDNESYVAAPVIEYSTISGNSGGGIYGNAVTLRSTIVAVQASGPDCAASTTDGGYNLDDDGTCGLSSANHSLSNTNPLLDPAGLANNGGPTQTIALEPGSPAIDAIAPGVNGCGTNITMDQRGVTRPQGPGCDFGAYEVEQATPVQLLAALGKAVIGVGPGTSLADKVAQALAYLNSGDVSDTCSTLTAFINEVKAQSSKTIPQAQAATLIASAQQIKTLLGC